MTLDPAVGAVGHHHEQMVERAVKDVVTQRAPMIGGGFRRRGGRQFGAHVTDGHFAQFGMAVRAVTLIGDPIGPQIALLKHMHAKAARMGQINGDRVDGPRVAVKHDVGDGFFRQDDAQILSPIGQRAGVGDIAAVLAPEKRVTGIKAHAMHDGAGPFQFARQLGKKRTMRALKHQEPARGEGLFVVVCLYHRCVIAFFKRTLGQRRDAV